ncbi:unnamed protein product, partial [Meganyctiphanes norvegica]
CMAQCPLCGVICSRTIAHPGEDHTAPSHYIRGLQGGYTSDTKELWLESCNEKVAGNEHFRNTKTDMKIVKYKDYRSVNDSYASWSIVADTSHGHSLYWKWVFAKFTEQLVKYWSNSGNKIKCTKIPSKWKNITEEEVDESIRIMFQ